MHESTPTLEAPLTLVEAKQEIELIVIIELGCRFHSGADTPETFW